LGADLAKRLDGLTIRLLADNTSDDDEPFLEFELPENAPTGNQSVTRHIPILFLKGPRNRADGSAEQPDCTISTGGLLHPDPAKYTAFLALVEKTLRKMDSSEVIIRSSAPASLTFGAGLIAGRLGIKLQSQAFEDPHYSSPTSLPRSEPWTRDKGAAKRWWWTLGATTALLGLCVPLLSGAIALALEWGLARSGGDEILPWGWLALVLAVSGVASLLSYSVRRRGMESPEVSLRVDASGSPSTWRPRSVRVPRVDDVSTQAQSISDAFSDAVSALPAVSKYEVDLTPLTKQCARDVVCHRNHGLDRTLRARRPVHLTWQDQVSIAGPRADADKQWPT
jgi:hypothetical protein